MRTGAIPNGQLARSLFRLIGVDKYKVRHVKSKQQGDASSCGVYALLNAWKLTRGLPLLGEPNIKSNGASTRAALARCIVRNSTQILDDALTLM